MFQVEVKWNRSFNFVPHGPRRDTLEAAIEYARELENMGDGASVKSTRITNEDGKVVFANGKEIK